MHPDRQVIVLIIYKNDVMKFYNKKIAKWIPGLFIVFLIIPAFTLFTLLDVPIKCGSDKAKKTTTETNLPPLCVEAKDSLAAVSAFRKWVGAKSKVDCQEKHICSPADCIPFLTGYTKKDSIPPPTKNDAGQWCWPGTTKKVVVWVKCICLIKVVDVALVDLEADDFPLVDPLIGETDGEEIDIRTRDAYEKIKLYPNPAGDVLNLSFEEVEWEDKLTITIYDAMGKIMEVREVEHSDYEKNVLQLETLHYPNGIYYLSINSERGILMRSKIMVSDI